VPEQVPLKRPLIAVLLLAALAVSAAPLPAKPNIIVILSDDLGWADLGCYGSRFHESPNLDKLAIGAAALVTQGMKIPPGSLVLGAPAKVVRTLTRQERAGLKTWAAKYVANTAYCLKHGINVNGPLPG
jgi:hypothetical protein